MSLLSLAGLGGGAVNEFYSFSQNPMLCCHVWDRVWACYGPRLELNSTQSHGTQLGQFTAPSCDALSHSPPPGKSTVSPSEQGGE